MRIQNAYEAWLLGMALVLTTPIPLHAKPLEDAPIPYGFGVSVHNLGKDAAELDAVYKAGFRIIRKDLMWESVEKTKGVYSWASYDPIAAKAKSLGIRPLFILDYSNPLYAPDVFINKKDGTSVKKTAAPTSLEGMQAFANFAAAAVAHYRKYNPIWEIWNEPEHDTNWAPKSDPKAFASLVTHSCLAMRGADSSATIIAPGAAEKPTFAQPLPPMLETMMERGALDCLDGISIHPYLWASQLDGQTPEVWDALKRLIQKHFDPKTGKNPPVPVNSESGLSTYSGRISDELQASYLVRMMLLDAEAHVPVSIWYDWKDNGNEPDNPEHHFGVMEQDGRTPKPAVKAMQVMASELEGYRFKCRSPRAEGDVSLLVFDRDDANDLRLVAWKKKGAADAELYLNQSVEASGMFGEAVKTKAQKGKIVLPLDDRPVYFRMQKQAAQDSSLCAPGR